MNLSPYDPALVSTVLRFRQASSSQLRRLHFEGTPAGCQVRQRRACARLVKRGQLRRIEGPTEYIYLPPGSRTTIPDQHTLEITELYIRLNESGLNMLAFDPEPYCHEQVGHLELKPDAFVDLRNKSGRYRYWIELDRGTEFRPQLKAKMRRYVQAYHHWPEKTYPLILWLTPDPMRSRLIEGVIKRQETPGLFAVTEFENAIDYLS